MELGERRAARRMKTGRLAGVLGALGRVGRKEMSCGSPGAVRRDGRRQSP